MSVARSRRCCVHDATPLHDLKVSEQTPQEQTNGYARKSRLHRKGRVRDRCRERHRPRGGAIVNTSSGAGIIGIKGSPAYTAAKHGVIGLTRAAALDYAAQNIRVNAVCPGYIDTAMMGRFTGGTPEGRAKVIAEEPVGRMGKPEEIAAAVLWLCSDAAAFIVGHAMVIDGGQTIQ